MSKPLDYSKWDKMDFSDDEDDDGQDTISSSHGPRVTRLDGPSRVTCTPNGSVEIQENASVPTTTMTTTNVPAVDVSNDSLETNTIPSRNPKSSTIAPHEVDRIEKRLTKNGGSYLDPATKNTIFWSQDRKEVILTISYDFKSIRSKDIRVNLSGAIPYQDRCAAVSNPNSTASDANPDSKGSLTVMGGERQEIVLLQGELPHFVYLSEGEEEMDWEIDVTDPDRKLIKITFLKAVPMSGVVIWWSRPLLHFPEIDVVKDIEGRGSMSKGDVSPSVSVPSKQEQMKEAWEEAHRMFREKIKKKELKTID